MMEVRLGCPGHMGLSVHARVLGLLRVLGHSGLAPRPHGNRLLHRRAEPARPDLRARGHRHLLLGLELLRRSRADLYRRLSVRLHLDGRHRDALPRRAVPEASMDSRQALRLRHAGRDAGLLLQVRTDPGARGLRGHVLLGALSRAPAPDLGLPVQRGDERPGRRRVRHVGADDRGGQLRRLRRPAHRGLCRCPPGRAAGQRHRRDRVCHPDPRRRLGAAAGRHRRARRAGSRAHARGVQPLHRHFGGDPACPRRHRGRGQPVDRRLGS